MPEGTTPGPWTAYPLEDDKWGRWAIHDTYPQDLASVDMPPDTATRRANAHLMASSPDLYEALAHLVRLLEPLERDGRLDVPGLATLNRHRAALAKARGES